MIDFKNSLDAIDPRLWWVLVALVVYLVVYLWRVLSPKLPEPLRFSSLPSRFKALPAALLGLAMGVTSVDNDAEVVKMIVDLVLSAVAGVTAVGGHETLRRLSTGAGASGKPSAPLPPE